MFLQKFGDLLMGIFFLIFAAAMFLMSNALPPSLMGGLGSDFMPKIIAAFIAVLAVLQTYSGYQVLKQGGSQEAAAEEADKPEYHRVLATIAAFTVYVFVLKTVGFIISSSLYLLIQMMVLATREKRNLILFVVISVTVSVVVYFIFRNGLSVMLPAGMLG